MKKFFIIVVLAIISTSSFSTEVVVNDTTALTFNKVYEDVKEGIQGLAVALKAPAEHVYSILIKQQYVKAVVGLFIIVLTLMFILLTFKYAANIKDWNDGEAYEGKPSYSLAVFVACAIFSFFFLIGTFAGGFYIDVFQGFINPEYGAIKDIISFIK